jgi:hypothetical protein
MKPAKPVAGKLSRQEIAELAHAYITANGPASSTDIGKDCGADPAIVAVALQPDQRFTRSVSGGVLRWQLTAPKTAMQIKHADWLKPTSPASARVFMPDAPTLVIEEINPKRAAELLAMSEGNRKLREGHIDWLCRQITEGCWRLTPQSIAVSASGRLLDGHHRLNAIIRSGKSVLTSVSYGWSEDGLDAIDCGIVRLPQDRFSLIPDSLTWNARAVEIIHSILRIEFNLRGKATNQQLAQAWQSYRGGILMIRSVFPEFIKRLTRTPLFGALARYHQQEPAKAAEFAEQLRGDRAAGEPSQQLRDLLLGGGWVAAGYRGNTEIYWRSVAAMSAHRDGRRLEQLTAATSWSTAANHPPPRHSRRRR